MTASKLRRLNFHGPLPLRSQLTLLVVATVLPLILFSGLMIYLLAQRERATFQQGATERMRAISTAVDTALKGSITTLDALASNEDLRNGNLRGFYDAAARVLKTHPDWSTINLADRSGQQIINLLRPFGAELPKVPAAAEITQVLETKRPVIGNIMLGPVTKQYDVAVRIPVFNFGALSYVLSAVIKPDSIGNLLSAQQLPSNWNGLVLDGNNRFVTRSTRRERFVGQLASESLRAALARSRDGWFRGVNVDGSDVYTAYSRSPFSSWAVAMNIPSNVVDAPLRGSVLYVILLGAGLLALGIALAWWLSSKTADSIESLVEQVTDLGLGKEAAPAAANDVPVHIAEVGRLRDAFSAALRLIQERSEERDCLVEALRQDATQRERAERFHLLQIATSKALTDSHDIQSATPKIVQAICELAGWEVGAIWNVDQAAAELKSVEIWHVPNISVPEFEAACRRKKFAPGLGRVGRVWASGKAAWIPDVTKDSNFLRTQEAIKEGLHAGVCFPIKVGENVLGVVELFSREIREPDDAHLQTLANIGNQIGQFVERRRAEDALQKSQAQFSGIINSVMDAVIVVDHRQRIVLFNPAAEEMFGCTSTEVVGKSLDPFIPRRFREAHPTHIENFGQTGITSRRMGALGALSALRANGEEFPIEASISQLELGGGKLFTVVLRDITARKHASQLLEEAARQKEALYQFVERRHRAKSLDKMCDAALEAILSALSCHRASIFLSHESGVMRFVAGRGLSEDYCKTVEGHSPWKSDDPDPQPVCVPEIGAAQLDECLKTIVSHEGIVALAFIPLIVNGKLAGKFMTYYDEPHVFSDEELDLSLTLAHQLALGIERKRAEDEIAQLNKDLERRVKQRTDQLQQANAALLRDIEERKKLEIQLLQSQKMESIGTLAGGVAHDFNNILNIIQAYASALSEQGTDNQQIKQSVTVINETVERGSAVVKQLLAMARKSPGIEFEPVDVNGVIESLLPLIKETFPKTVELSSTLESNVPPIMADKIQIEQVLLNLCVNARDAMPNGGRLSLKTSLVDGAALQLLGDPEQRYVCIGVSDTGVGIDESIRERIFEPFFTTKEKTQGTGLGLSVVYGIVKNHNGLIDIESKPMAGATFRLYFPIANGKAMTKEPSVEVAAEKTEIVNGVGTALLAEDEPNMLHFLERMFLRRGYKVLTATDGESVLDLYQQHKAEINVILVDLGLPKISGRDVVSKIRSENPDVKAVVTSGYIDPATKSQIEHAGAKFLQKPYSSEDVFKALRNLAAPAS